MSDRMEYEEYEFCKDVRCPSFLLCLQESDTLIVDCVMTAKEYHKWLKEKGFKIIKGG